MTRHAFIAAALFAASLIAAPAPAPGQATEQPQQAFRERRLVEPAPLDLVATAHIDLRLWSERTRYHIGDRASLSFSADRDCRIYIFSTEASGVTRQIFPNAFDTDNTLRAGRVYSIPDRGYELQVNGPPGTDIIHAVATTLNEPWLRDEYGASSRGEAFPVRPQGADGLKKKLDQSEKDAATAQRRAASDQKTVGPQLGVVPVPPPPPPCSRGEAWLELRILRDGRGGWSDPSDHEQLGELSIRTSPSMANVYLNESYYGRTPLTVHLPAGRYELEITKPGFERYRSTVHIEPGTEESIRARLERW